MHITNISDAKANLSSLIKMLHESHEPIIIGKAGKPVAILSEFKEDLSPRILGGSWEGHVEILEGFDDEITESFYTSSLFPD